jgi:hypothetical protein
MVLESLSNRPKLCNKGVKQMDKEQLIELLKELFKDGRIEIFPSRRNSIKVVIDCELVQED